MPQFRLWPAKYPITVETTSPPAYVGSLDAERIGAVGNSWGDRTWSGEAIAHLRRQLEERCRAAKDDGEISSNDPSTPLASVIEDVLRVVVEAERVSEAYLLQYVGD